MKKSSNLIVIENGQLTSYTLDDRQKWEVGRISKENYPDIVLHSITVSRRHGSFQNREGAWIYRDYIGKNGTIYNNRKIQKDRRGAVVPIPLADRDVLIFGGGEEPVINRKTVWAMFSISEFGDEWRCVDMKDEQEFLIKDGEDQRRFCSPPTGTVIGMEHGMAIYMGNLLYLNGEIELS